MASKIGIVLALDGEKEFTNGMKQAQQSAKLFNQEMKNLESEYKGSANSLEALTKKQEVLQKQQRNYNNALKSAQDGQKNAVKQYQEATKNLDKLNDELDEARKALQKMEDAGDDSSKAYKDQAKAVKELEQAVQKQSDQQAKASTNITKWDTAVTKAQGDVERTNSAVEKNAQYVDEASKAADKCATSIDKMGNEASQAAGEVDKVSVSLGDMIKAKAVDLAGDAVRELGQKAIEAAKYVVEVGSKFEASMSKVEALSGASTEQLEQMSQKAQELGSSTKFSASEVADGFSYMALAGWDANQSIAAIEGIVNLAAASEMELADASDMVTDYLSAFGMEASEAGKMADMMAYAQANSNTTTQQLGDAFGNCAANMNAAGQDMKTTTSFLEAFANQGIKGSEAGTKLSAIMRDITAKMKDGAIQIGDTSVAVTDSEGNFRDLTDIMLDVEAATEGMGTAERSAALSATFTSRSVGGLNMILAEGVENIANYESQLESCDGAAADMAGTMQNNLQGAITEMNSAAEGLGIALYERVSGPLTDAVQFATDLISKITDIIRPQQTVLDEFIEATKQANDEARAAVDNAKAALEKGETDVAKLDAMAGIIEEANEQFKLFAEVDTSAAAEDVGDTAEKISASAEDIEEDAQTTKEALDDVGDADTSEAGDNLKQTGEAITEASDGIKTDAEDTKTKLEDIGNADLSAEDLKAELGSIRESMANASSGMDEFTKFQVKSAVMELAKSIPAIGEAWDDVAGKLDMTETKFKSLVDTEKRAIMESAIAKAETEAMEGFAKATLAQASAQAGLNHVFKEANKLMDEIEPGIEHNISSVTDLAVAYDSTKGAVGELYAEAMDLDSDLQKANATLAESEEVIQAQAEASDIVSKEYGFGAEAANQNAEATNKAAEASANATESEEAHAEALAGLTESYQQSSEAAEAHKAAVDEITEAYESAKEAAEDAFSVNPFDEWSQNAENGLAKMQESFDSQIEGMTNYADNLQTVSEHVGKEITPEFLQYLEGLGVGGAQVVQDLANAFESGDTEAVETLMQSYVQAMNKQSEIANALAMDNVAFQLGLNEFSSSAEEWEGLDAAVDYIANFGDGLTSTTREAFTEAAETARECGVAIPDGLKEGIESGTDNPEQAVQRATEKINQAIQGRAEGLLKAAQDAGIAVPHGIADGISKGGSDAVSAYHDLVSLIGSSSVGEAADTARDGGAEIVSSVAEGITDNTGEATSAAESMTTAAKEASQAAAAEFSAGGTAAGTAFAEGLRSMQGATNQAGSMIAQLSASHASQQSGEFESAGAEDGTAFASGLGQQMSAASTAGQAVAEAGKSGASSVGGWDSIGSNMASGVAAGIRAQINAVASAAADMVRQAMAAARAEANIASPSKKFRDMVGKMIGAGTAQGIKLSTKQVTSAVEEQMAETLRTTQQWLEKNQKKIAKTGTDMATATAYAYTQASEKLIKKNFGVSKYTTETVKDEKGKVVKDENGKEKTQQVLKETAKYYSELYSTAQKYYSNMADLYDMSTADEIAYWKKVQKKFKEHSTEWVEIAGKLKSLRDKQAEEQKEAAEKALKAQEEADEKAKEEAEKAAQDQKDARQKIIDDAEDYVEKQKETNNMSVTAEIAYWEKIKAQLQEGTEEYETARKKIVELKKEIGTVSNADDLWDVYTTYYDTNNRQEAQYWDEVRKHYEAGTAERIKADKKYLAAHTAYLKELEEEDKEYEEERKRITEESEKEIADLQAQIAENEAEIEQSRRDLNDNIVKEEKELAKKIVDINTKLNSDILKANKKLDQDIGKAIDSRAKQIANEYDIFDEFESSSATGEQLLFNMQSQAAGYQDWINELQMLEQRGLLSKDLIAELTSKGVSNSAAIHALNMLSDDQLERYNEAYITKMQLAQAEAHRESMDASTELYAEIQGLREDNAADIESLRQTATEEIQKETEATTQAIANLKQETASKIDTLNASTKTAKDAIDANKKTTADALNALNKQHVTDTNAINKEINQDILNLAKNIKQISSDQVSALAAAFKEQAGLINGAETSVGTNVSNEVVQQVGATELVNPTPTPTTTTPTVTQPAPVATTPTPTTTTATPTPTSNLTDAQEAMVEIGQIIYSGKSRKKTLTAAEKKKSDLFQYLVTKYGVQPTTAMYKQLAKALGIDVSASVTTAQMTKMLKALKKKGFSAGTSDLDDFFAWMDEAGIGSEMIIRKSDSARLNTSVRPGDAIVPAANTANLWDWSKLAPADMLAVASEASLNARALAEAPIRQNADAMVGMMTDMFGLMQEYMPYIAAARTLSVDGRELAQATSPYTSNIFAMNSRRKRT